MVRTLNPSRDSFEKSQKKPQNSTLVGSLGISSYLLCALLGGVLSSLHPNVFVVAETGVLGLVPPLPDKQAEPNGEHALRFDFLYDRLRNKSLQQQKKSCGKGNYF